MRRPDATHGRPKTHDAPSARAAHTVYVLGAGASHEGGVPLAAQILPIGWQMLGALSARGPTRRGEGYLRGLDGTHAAAFRRVYEFIARVFQGRGSRTAVELAQAPMLDELWALLEIARDEHASFGVGVPADEVVRVRDALMTLMYHVLVGARVRYDAPAASGGYRVEFAARRPNPYGRFVARLRATDAVLALNYDTLLDRALSRAGRSIDYGTSVVTARRARGPRATLLKLHGSFNWLYCPSCHALEDFGGANVAHVPLERGARAARCPRDGAHRESVIVPPSLVKSYANLHIQRIWAEAAAQLRACRRVVFIGYAMSDSDVYVRYLVKQATALNPALSGPLRRGARPPVTAVDMSETGLASYERLFGRGRVECLRTPFRRYVEAHMGTDG